MSSSRASRDPGIKPTTLMPLHWQAGFFVCLFLFLTISATWEAQFFFFFCPWMWDLSPQPGIEPAPDAFEVRSLKH